MAAALSAWLVMPRSKAPCQISVRTCSCGQPESLLLNCSIELPADDLSVSGRDYIGGFAGALANSYTVNCTINMQQTDEDGQTSARALSVHGNGDSIGGWAGIGTVGWVSSLGGTGNGLENADKDLLATVGKVLTELLGSDNGDALLSLIGVAPLCHHGLPN